ncbi:MAG: ABC transporter ATP-binding protein [Pseudomonadota bacterium]
MKSPAISIANACLRYKDQILFDRLNFHLPAGMTTCLLGSSGIGKTSFLRLIAGLNTNAQADIYASDQKNLHTRIAYITQSDYLLPWLSVLDNVLLGYRLRRTKTKPLERAYELLKQLELYHALKKYPSQLSGGMQQRVALARILLEDRPILLMDEPFSALDTITRYQLHELAAPLLKDRTVLLITHDPLEALRLGHHIAIMSGQPAQIEYLDTALTTVPPRSHSNVDLLSWQSKLLHRLQECH